MRWILFLQFVIFFMQRIWEVDFLRGLSIAMMVLFHTAFDLHYLGIVPIFAYEGGWLLLQRTTISLFLILVGVSLWLKFRKMQGQPSEIIVKKFGKRAALLFAAALLISLATWIAVPSEFIVFGVIHLIALSTLLALPFLRFYRANLLLGAVLLASSFFITLPKISMPVLLWLGFTFPGFVSLDYVPLFPWFGLVLIGIFAGKFFYMQANSIVEKPRLQFVSWFQFAGRNSLLLYLAHQPLLFAALEAYLALKSA